VSFLRARSTVVGEKKTALAIEPGWPERGL
jgi:hypothetical protein